MKDINLDEILRKEWGVLSQEGDLQLAIVLNSDVKKIKSAMLEFGKLLLDAAAENVQVSYFSSELGEWYTVDKDSITSVLDAVKR